MKRTILITLAIVMIFTILGGCLGNNDEPKIDTGVDGHYIKTINIEIGGEVIATDYAISRYEGDIVTLSFDKNVSEDLVNESLYNYGVSEPIRTLTILRMREG